MPYHSLYNTVASSPTIISTILAVRQGCAAILMW